MSIDTSTLADLVDQYADALDLNWRRRSHLLRSHVADFFALAAWDARILTSAETLQELGAFAREPLRRRLSEPLSPGELFAIGLYGFTVNDAELLQACNAVAQALPHLQAAWLAAVQWAPPSPGLQQSLAFLPLNQQMLALALRRGDGAINAEQVRQVFAGLDQTEWRVETVRATLMLIRVTADHSRLNAASHFLKHEHPMMRLEAAHTLMVLGHTEPHQRSACDVLIDLIDTDKPQLREAATQCLCLHGAHPQEMLGAITPALRRVADRCASAAERDELARLYLRALGWLGVSDGVPVLLHHLSGPHRRTAAASLSLMTGADPVRDGWQGEPPADVTATTSSRDDHIPALDPEIGMLWPDAPRFEKWWAQHANRFDPKLRYFAGRPLAAHNLEQTLWRCPLAWRPWACEHLQRLTHQPLFPWDAPAWVQQSSNASRKDLRHVH